MRDFCVQCWKAVDMPKGYNQNKHVPVCSQECWDAEGWFRHNYRDENYTFNGKEVKRAPTRKETEARRMS